MTFAHQAYLLPWQAVRGCNQVDQIRLVRITRPYPLARRVWLVLFFCLCCDLCFGRWLCLGGSLCLGGGHELVETFEAVILCFRVFCQLAGMSLCEWPDQRKASETMCGDTSVVAASTESALDCLWRKKYKAYCLTVCVAVQTTCVQNE